MTYYSLILALSLDTFIAALSYESNKIKIPIESNLIISFICALVLMISLLFGNILDSIIPNNILKFISFTILFLIGIFKIFDNRIKKFIKTKNFLSKKINFSFCNLKFILQIYSDYKYADADKSKTLSPFEAISLALALSLDGFGAGLAFSPSLISIINIFIICLVVNFLLILSARIFNNLASKFDFSLLGGLIFIVLAFFRL